MSVLGIISPDPVGQALKTGYDRFESSNGIGGLCRVKGRHLDILVIQSEFEGRGYFKQFIGLCKLEFDSIGVWEIMNPDLVPILERWGFSKRDEVESIDGKVEFVSGYCWSRSA